MSIRQALRLRQDAPQGYPLPARYRRKSFSGFSMGWMNDLK
jgi:hypothetical protein